MYQKALGHDRSLLLLAVAVIANIVNSTSCLGASANDQVVGSFTASNPDASDCGNLQWEQLQQLMFQANISWQVADGLAEASTFKTQPLSNSSSTGVQMHTLFNCLNASHVPSTPGLTFEQAMGGQVEQGSVRAIATFWSSQPSSTTTVVTSSSFNRLKQLFAQCKSWPGPISAALYLSVHQPDANNWNEDTKEILMASIVKVAEFMVAVKKMPGACQPDILLVSEIYTDYNSSTLLYPINAMRNLAMLQARTPLIALIDVDLLLSKSLQDRLLHTGRAQEVLQQACNKTVFVIPAFDVSEGIDKSAWAAALTSSDKVLLLIEAAGRREKAWLDEPTMPSFPIDRPHRYQNQYTNTEMVLHSLDKKLVFQFALDIFPPGHAATNYALWRTSTSDYEVGHQHNYEPWIVGARTHLPWFDPRYWTYGKDKIQFIAHVASLGFKFKVFHDAYAIHRAHKPIGAAAAVRNSATNNFSHNWEQFAKQVQLHNQGLPFIAPMTPSVLNCSKALPWWQSRTSNAAMAALR